MDAPAFKCCLAVLKGLAPSSCLLPCLGVGRLAAAMSSSFVQPCCSPSCSTPQHQWSFLFFVLACLLLLAAVFRVTVPA